MADGAVQDTKLVLKLQDEGTQKGKMQFGASSTITLAKAFLLKYSKAGITGANKIETLECAGVDVTAGANVDKKILITARDSVTAEVIRFSIPAYLEGVDLVLVPGVKGSRLDEATGQTICDDWKTANALANDLIFLNGTPVMRP